MSVGRIATRVVATASPEESVLQVARRMTAFNVGCVVVVNQDGEPVGIVTDRDIVTRGVADEISFDDATVGSLMTEEPRTCHETAPIEEAVALMGDSGLRRLVVVDDDGKLVGLVSVDDVMELLVEEARSIGRLLGREAPTFAAR